MLNETLLSIAEWNLKAAQEKAAREALKAVEKDAFVPPPSSGAAMGMPGAPMGAAGGGMPPGGMPIDPSMMSGMPIDPSMMSGMPAGPSGAGGGIDPNLLASLLGQGASTAPPPEDSGLGMDPSSTVDQIANKVVAALQQGAAAGAQGKKPVKVDPNTIYTEIVRIRKLLLDFYRKMGWELPLDILDDPLSQDQSGSANHGNTGAQNSGSGGQDKQAGFNVYGDRSSEALRSIFSNPSGSIDRMSSAMQAIEYLFKRAKR